jgi:hypothetical protein
MNDINVTTQNVLSASEVSLCEHFLMCTIGYTILLPLEELAQTSASLNEGDRRGQFTPAQYMQALDACIKKKWLRVITGESYEQEMNRRPSSAIPEIYGSGFAPGVVDFTETGYLLHRQIIIDIYGMQHIQYDASGWNIDEIRQEVHVYAPTKELCIKRLEELKRTPSNYIGQRIHRVVASAPKPIGRWKPDHFLLLPHGFYAVIKYQLYNEDIP